MQKRMRGWVWQRQYIWERAPKSQGEIANTTSQTEAYTFLFLLLPKTTAVQLKTIDPDPALAKERSYIIALFPLKTLHYSS